MFEAIFRNQLLWTAIAASTLAQVVKVMLILLSERKWQPARFLETGGMPSSHTASVAALATFCGLEYGFDSPYFAISAVFGMIVMYDATGIRRASGMQAELLNDLVVELRQLLSQGFAPKPLKELLGHTYLEVFVGLLLGIIVAVVSHALY
ncbi:MAG: divergent PAP2 family protein [Pleurocapsa sp. SU_196_0]|nr:divergent PAP2 family protein [Pleurocapsa sp. SU_196_0]